MKMHLDRFPEETNEMTSDLSQGPLSSKEIESLRNEIYIQTAGSHTLGELLSREIYHTLDDAKIKHFLQSAYCAFLQHLDLSSTSNEEGERILKRLPPQKALEGPAGSRKEEIDKSLKEFALLILKELEEQAAEAEASETPCATLRALFQFFGLPQGPNFLPLSGPEVYRWITSLFDAKAPRKKLSHEVASGQIAELVENALLPHAPLFLLPARGFKA